MVTPFRVELDPAVIDDLRSRLRATRWPEAETVPGWQQGTPLAFARDLCAYWADGYDWPAAAVRLNRHPQFHTEIDGLAVHFVHARSSRPDAVPLVMTHGWPGSVVEFAEVIGPLTDRGFHVVCPSLPGYGFSGQPASPGWTVHRIADAWAELMARLGYRRFLSQGHDWGTSVSAALAQRHPDRLLGIHLMPRWSPPTRPRSARSPPPSRPPSTIWPRPSPATVTHTCSPPGPRRSATPWSIPPPPSAPGSWKNSTPGPTVPATCPATSCSTI